LFFEEPNQKLGRWWWYIDRIQVYQLEALEAPEQEPYYGYPESINVCLLRKVIHGCLEYLEDGVVLMKER
jgi:hypothetical protein